MLFLLSATSSTPVPAHDDISLPSVELTQSQKAWLKSGDIIFRKAEGLVSDAIISVDAGSDYSHAGLVRRVGDKITVINAAFGQEGITPAVYEQDLDQFLSGSPLITVYRLRHGADQIASRVIQIAVEQLGTPFDFDLNKDNGDSLYCTELVWLAYQRAGIELMDGHFSELDLPFLGKGFYILPSDLAGSSYLFKVMTVAAKE